VVGIDQRVATAGLFRQSDGRQLSQPPAGTDLGLLKVTSSRYSNAENSSYAAAPSYCPVRCKSRVDDKETPPKTLHLQYLDESGEVDE
jgi:hypothetical protein